jgi:hypothetical protein
MMYIKTTLAFAADGMLKNNCVYKHTFIFLYVKAHAMETHCDLSLHRKKKIVLSIY